MGKFRCFIGADICLQKKNPKTFFFFFFPPSRGEEVSCAGRLKRQRGAAQMLCSLARAGGEAPGVSLTARTAAAARSGGGEASVLLWRR